MTQEILPQMGARSAAPRAVLEHNEMQGPFHLPAGVEGLSLALYQSCGVPLVPGHAVQLVENGAIFDALVDAIRSARTSVHVLVYIWRPCAASDRIIEALVERARAGVACRIVVDPVGSEDTHGDKDFDQGPEQQLREAGCEVHYYRLLRNRLVGRMMGRIHQKIAVVDGQVGITGGFGIWKVWEGAGLAVENWRDTHVRVQGPAVRELQLAFSAAWQEAGGPLLPADVFPPTGDHGSVLAGFVASAGQLGLTRAERMYRVAIAAATKRLWIANAYFTPPDKMLEQLVTKAREGVDVRVLAPGPVHDVPTILASQRSTYERLLEAGVRIWEYQPSMMHAKTMLADDWLSMVGSTNLDPLSLNKLSEGSLVIADAAFTGQLARSFEQDLTHSQEITLENGGRTSLWKRFARRATQVLGKDRF